MCRHHRKTQRDKVAIAKLKQDIYEKLRDAKPKFTTVLQFGHWPHQKVNTVPQIDLTIWGMPCLTRKLVFANVKSRQEV